MLKKLRRNASFLPCTNCERGGFLQVGESRKEHVKCPLCQTAQTIEKGVHAGLDPGEVSVDRPLNFFVLFPFQHFNK